MPRGRKPEGGHALSNAERQARHRARQRLAHPAPSAVRARRPTDRRSRPQRWRDAVAELQADTSNGWTHCRFARNRGQVGPGLPGSPRAALICWRSSADASRARALGTGMSAAPATMATARKASASPARSMGGLPVWSGSWTGANRAAPCPSCPGGMSWFPRSRSACPRTARSSHSAIVTPC